MAVCWPQPMRLPSGKDAQVHAGTERTDMMNRTMRPAGRKSAMNRAIPSSIIRSTTMMTAGAPSCFPQGKAQRHLPLPGPARLLVPREQPGLPVPWARQGRQPLQKPRPPQ